LSITKALLVTIFQTIEVFDFKQLQVQPIICIEGAYNSRILAADDGQSEFAQFEF